MPAIRLQTFLMLTALACSMPAFCVSPSTTPAKAVVAYVFPQNNALQPGEIDAQSLTRINYAFANIEDGRMVRGFAKDEENFAFLVSLKRQNPSLTVLV